MYDSWDFFLAHGDFNRGASFSKRLFYIAHGNGLFQTRTETAAGNNTNDLVVVRVNYLCALSGRSAALD